MASGLPDWSKVKTALDFEFSNDNAELAARLKSPLRYYRSGNVIAFTGFETGDDFVYPTATGASAFCNVATNKALTGAQSLKMSLSVGDTACTIMKRLPYHASGIVALSYAIDITELTYKFYSQFIITKDDIGYQFRLTLDDDAETFSIITASGVSVVIAPFVNFAAPNHHQWFTIKMFMDSINLKYYALDLNGTLHDLTAYSPNQLANPVNDNVDFSLGLFVPLVGVNTVYIDNLVYTINDPS